MYSTKIVGFVFYILTNVAWMETCSFAIRRQTVLFCPYWKKIMLRLVVMLPLFLASIFYSMPSLL